MSVRIKAECTAKDKCRFGSGEKLCVFCNEITVTKKEDRERYFNPVLKIRPTGLEIQFRCFSFDEKRIK